jgi:hypothetical protein
VIVNRKTDFPDSTPAFTPGFLAAKEPLWTRQSLASKAKSQRSGMYFQFFGLGQPKGSAPQELLQRTHSSRAEDAASRSNLVAIPQKKS